MYSTLYITFIIVYCTTRKALRYGCDGLDWTKPSQSPWRMAVDRRISFGSCQLHNRLERMLVLNLCFYNYKCFYQAVHCINMRIKLMCLVMQVY